MGCMKNLLIEELMPIEAQSGIAFDELQENYFYFRQLAMESHLAIDALEEEDGGPFGMVRFAEIATLAAGSVYSMEELIWTYARMLRERFEDEEEFNFKDFSEITMEQDW